MFQIGKTRKPYIIAEMSGNHNQSLKAALKIVDKAAECKVDAVKLQTYTADTITLDCDSEDFIIKDAKSLWKGKKLHDLYKEAYTPWEWHEPIMKRCKEYGMDCFSTPFDTTSVDFLESLKVPCYKIASSEVVDIPLLKRVAKTMKPVIMSTGMASLEELSLAYETLENNGCPEIILLKCTANYPASPLNSNIKMISTLKKTFDCEIGLSDHTLGIGVAVASVGLGAVVIEKHFTLSRKEGGVDSAFSLEPEEMKALVVESERAWQALGKNKHIGYAKSEAEARNYRKSLYIAKDIKQGEILTEENIRSVRPGFGLSPKYYDIVIGRKAKKDLKSGTPLKWEDI